MASIAGLFKSILGICETRPLSTEMWSVEDGKVRIKLGQVPELSHKGGAVYLKGQGLDKPVLVFRTGDDQYLAFENKCSHGGRKIDPVTGESVLRCCSVGHSKFDYEGKHLGGPGKGPLTRYQVDLSEGDLVVTL